jgi:hypothetical protein
MVGLTGVAGGALLVPILVLLLHVPTIVAGGSGALFVVATKIGAAWSYHQRGLVDIRLVLRMAVGSIPGAALGRWIGPDPCPCGGRGERILESIYWNRPDSDPSPCVSPGVS